MTMRFISMHKASKDTEAGVLPSPDLMAGIGSMIGEMLQAGIFEAGEGLRPSSEGVRLKFSKGERSIVRGPFTGSNELTSAFSIVRVRTIDDAIEWATRFATVAADVEIDVRPVTEEWELGVAPPPPPGTPRRFMIQLKADRDSEAGAAPRLEPVTRAMSQAGVHVTTEILRPSREGLRLKYAGGKPRVIDGPFAESKELIAGYVILNLASRDQALEWCERFAKLFGDVEMDIRPLYEPAGLRH